VATIRIILSLSQEEEKSENPEHMKTKNVSLVLIPVLACFLTLPSSQAVSPPPDGDYPGSNTAEGQNALLSLTTGTYNTAVGWFSLQSNLTGNFNTAIGAGTLFANTADANTATGVGALLNNTTGANNTASGVFALFDNTTGDSNTATGLGALGDNATGSFNTAGGANALLSNTTGGNNTATGYQALFSNTIANGNTATGFQALLNNTTGGFNTATGWHTLYSNTAGVSNTANGVQALVSNTIGGANTAIGGTALRINTTGGANTAIGNGALSENTTGDSNTALGISAGSGVTTGTNVICIGSDGANVNNSCFIGNIRGVTTAITDAIPVVIDSAGQLGTMSSSYRFKKDINTMEKSSEAVLSLRPVTFHYKTDTKSRPQFGLIAEEVAKVNPDLVVRDKKGEIYTVRYDAVNAMLLNEFLKEHRKNEEQEAIIAQLKQDSAEQRKQIETLTAGLQRVSNQLELSKPAPRAVVSTQ
jgi:hypothetical protein